MKESWVASKPKEDPHAPATIEDLTRAMDSVSIKKTQTLPAPQTDEDSEDESQKASKSIVSIRWLDSLCRKIEQKQSRSDPEMPLAICSALLIAENGLFCSYCFGRYLYPRRSTWKRIG